MAGERFDATLKPDDASVGGYSGEVNVRSYNDFGNRSVFLQFKPDGPVNGFLFGCQVADAQNLVDLLQQAIDQSA